jgi:hypothetical protein
MYKHMVRYDGESVSQDIISIEAFKERNKNISLEKISDFRHHGFAPYAGAKDIDTAEMAPWQELAFGDVVVEFDIAKNETSIVNRSSDTYIDEEQQYKDWLKNQTRIKRLSVEQNGFSLDDGTYIYADSKSQHMIHMTYTALKDGLINSVNFKIEEDTWVDYGLAEFTVIFTKLNQHIQNTFLAEKTVFNAIDSITTFDGITTFDVSAEFDAAFSSI